jgi:5-methylcytosine-specific restriction protein A
VAFLGPRQASETGSEEGWSDEELLATIVVYKTILDLERSGAGLNKAKQYRELSTRFERSPKAFERRMQNISAVLDAWDEPWIEGLKPLRNIGSNVRPRIVKLIREVFVDRIKVEAAYEQKVIEQTRAPTVVMPSGQTSPSSTVRQITTFARDAAVKAWALRRADGDCECCRQPAPFRTIEGFPFLEVHHLKTLASGGTDTVSNAVAICPNCHRQLHYGEDASDLRRQLLANVSELKRELPG